MQVYRRVRPFPDEWGDVYGRWRAGKITARDAMAELGLKRCAFYHMVEDYEGENPKGR